MAILVIVEHDIGVLASSLNTVAATEIGGDIDLLVAGHGYGGVMMRPYR